MHSLSGGLCERNRGQNPPCEVNIVGEEQSQWRKLDYKELRSVFLQAAAGEAKDADVFFNQFEYFQRLRERNYSAALDQGINLLATCKQIDADAYRRIHKGTPFYWLGTAAFLVHDYQTATFLFDAAVSEDIE